MTTDPVTTDAGPAQALYVRLEARPERAEALAALLRDAGGLVAGEVGTAAWFAVRMGETSFGLFGAFDDAAGCDAHLAGRIGALLRERAEPLLAVPPVLAGFDVLASRIR